MADDYVRPYLDSSVFIAWLRGEAKRHEIVAHILDEAQKGKYPIIISALTFAEVHKVKGDGKSHLTVEEDEKILAYFEHDFFRVVDVDRGIGEVANRFCRTYNVKPNDAIHLACALRAKCDVLLFWDRPFIEAVTHSAIRIEEPQITTPKQVSIFDSLKVGAPAAPTKPGELAEEAAPASPTAPAAAPPQEQARRSPGDDSPMPERAHVTREKPVTGDRRTTPADLVESGDVNQDVKRVFTDTIERSEEQQQRDPPKSLPPPGSPETPKK